MAGIEGVDFTSGMSRFSVMSCAPVYCHFVVLNVRKRRSAAQFASLGSKPGWVPAIAETFLIGVAVLRNDRRYPLAAIGGVGIARPLSYQIEKPIRIAAMCANLLSNPVDDLKSSKRYCA